jgi:hypothetical protein
LILAGAARYVSDGSGGVCGAPTRVEAMSRRLVATAVLSVLVCAGSAAACVDDADCDDLNDCTADTCTPANVCLNDPLPNGTSCPSPGGDGNYCNGAETCQGGICYPGYPVNVSDGNPCTIDGCDPITGGTHEIRPNGTPCPFPGGDGNICNGLETCQGGTCYPGYPLNVSDGNPCTIDGCNPITGGTNEIVANGTPCPDADVCDGEETCQQGVCTQGTALCSAECAGQNEAACLTALPLMSVSASVLLLGLLALTMGWALRRRAAAVRVVSSRKR